MDLRITLSAFAAGVVVGVLVLDTFLQRKLFDQDPAIKQTRRFSSVVLNLALLGSFGAGAWRSNGVDRILFGALVSTAIAIALAKFFAWQTESKRGRKRKTSLIVPPHWPADKPWPPEPASTEGGR